MLKSVLLSLSNEAQKPYTISISLFKLNHGTVGLLKCSVDFVSVLLSRCFRKRFNSARICRLSFHLATHDLSRTCSKALPLELAKIKEELREALPACKPF